MKEMILILVPESTDRFLATIGALRSLNVDEDVGFHTFWPPEDRSMLRLLTD